MTLETRNSLFILPGNFASAAIVGYGKLGSFIDKSAAYRHIVTNIVKGIMEACVVGAQSLERLKVTNTRHDPRGG